MNKLKKEEKNKKTINKNRFIFYFIYSLLILIFSLNLIADPPTPNGISGHIYASDGFTQVPTGTDYLINNTASGTFIKSVTSFPVASESGYYSESISGVNGDLIKLNSWNLTNYGETNVILNDSMDDVDVILNLSRPTETTTEIISPDNDSVQPDFGFTVVSQLKLYGLPGVNCNAIMTFSNDSVAETNQTIFNLGDLNSGYTNNLSWPITPLSLGIVNISVNFTCDNSVNKFEELSNLDTVFNITIEDSSAPSIYLINPQNDVKTNILANSFSYNFTDFSPINNCTLFINNSPKKTNNSPVRGTTYVINENLNDGLNSWYIGCYDIYNNFGTSITRWITFDNKTRYANATDDVQGENIQILGENWTNGDFVVLNVTKPDLSSYSWTSKIIEILNTTFFVEYNDPVGVYNLTIFEQAYPFYNTLTSFTVSQRIQGLTTDKSLYSPNENAIINGYNFSANNNVSYSIYKNDSGIIGPEFPIIVSTDSQGDFTNYWNVTDICNGTYKLVATDITYTNFTKTIYFNTSKSAPCTDWSNTPSNITSIIVDDDISTPLNEIDLSIGASRIVNCDVTVKDEDGYSDIQNLNATFYYFQNESSNPDDNSTHYSISSCTQTGTNLNDEKYYRCSFNIEYYAKNGTWICNATATDSQGNIASENDTTLINTLYALSVTTPIDFGTLEPMQISEEKNITVTNLGNLELDIGIDAYANVDNDGIAMDCLHNNITYNSQRYSIISGTNFDSMTPVTDTLNKLINFNLAKQTSSQTSKKNVYFKLRPDSNAQGQCTGIIVITAT